MHLEKSTNNYMKYVYIEIFANSSWFCQERFGMLTLLNVDGGLVSVIVTLFCLHR